MDVLDAFMHTVRDFPGGAEALAPRLGMSAGVLRNKADRKKDSNKPLLEDADKVMAVTGDHRILHSLALSHDHVCLPVGSDAPASDLAVLELVTMVWRSNGDVGQAVHEVLADRRVEKHELPRVRERIYQEIQTLQALYRRLEEMAE